MVVTKPDLIAGSALFLAGGFFGLWAWRYFPEGSENVPGPAFFPLVLCGLLATAGVYLIAEAIRDKGLPELRLPSLYGLSKILMLTVLYVGIFTPTGFLFSTALFVAAMMFTMNVRSPAQLILVPLSAMALIWFFFQFYLGVPLP
jgi:putative tricarboxylic transport membrane protein